MKKILSFLISSIVMLLVVACSTNEQVMDETPEVGSESTEVAAADVFKVGIILIGDENEGYSYSHIEGITNAIKELNLDTNENLIIKYNIGETAAAYDACVDLAEQGCKLIITNSYGHQSFCQTAASEYPEIEFVAMTGDTAKKSGLSNFHNAFTKIYEARYLGGVAAGLKIQQLVNDGILAEKNYDENNNVKVGYVGAYPYAEVVSGYTAFYLGIKSVVENVTMQVQYTNSWSDMTAEFEAATALINNGCVIIGQHADTTGAPSATEELLNAGNVCYSVGYNIDMLAVAPNAALTSPTNNWKNYYKYIIETVKNGNTFETDWAEGLESDSVRITTISDNCAEGTVEKIEEVKNAIKNGSLNVFDINTFTVDGNKVESAMLSDTDGDSVPDSDEAIFDGYYHESHFQSAPSFQLRIDGIEELN